MTAEERRGATEAAEKIARKSAQYELCGVANSADLRKSLLDFGRRCGATDADLKLIGGAYDRKRSEQMKALVNGNYVCPVPAASAREMIARDLVAIGAVDCKPTPAQKSLIP